MTPDEKRIVEWLRELVREHGATTMCGGFAESFAKQVEAGDHRKDKL